MIECARKETKYSEIPSAALKYYLKHGGKIAKIEYLSYYIPAGFLGVYTIYATPPKLSQINIFKRGLLLVSLPFTIYTWGMILSAQFRVHRKENIINQYLEQTQK